MCYTSGCWVSRFNSLSIQSNFYITDLFLLRTYSNSPFFAHQCHFLKTMFVNNGLSLKRTFSEVSLKSVIWKFDCTRNTTILYYLVESTVAVFLLPCDCFHSYEPYFYRPAWKPCSSVRRKIGSKPLTGVICSQRTHPTGQHFHGLNSCHWQPGGFVIHYECEREVCKFKACF